MPYTFPDTLWPPQRRGIELTIELLEQGHDAVCLYSPTGGGKTQQAIELFNWGFETHGWGGSFYVNRKLLVGQTAARFKAARLPYGIRAADYDDYYDHTAPFQICSADTERSRVYERKIWPVHYSRLVVVDECFPAGTPVGGVPIECIRPGDAVPCFDHESGAVALRPVKAVSVRPATAVCVVVFESGRRLTCTPSHPIWSRTRCDYVTARSLGAGEEVLRLGANHVQLADRVAHIEVYEQTSGREFGRLCPGGAVFNLQVAEFNNYFAGGYLVHNCHLQRTGTMKQILADQKARGGKVVLLTATPIGLSAWADKLVVSGRMQEYRECKALVPAIFKTIEQPDMSKVKRNKTGEYVLDGKKRDIYTQAIVGSVLDRWKKYNPDGRPTMLFAPGVAESIWFTEQFRKMGVNWCHVDATDTIVDGKRAALTRGMWEEIIERFKNGSIHGLSCRFKLREGLDVPCAYCAIFATPVGSLASYIQSVGRVMRYSPETPDHVIVIDHGGNYLRHGSPNHDRDWAAWWDLPENAVSEMHVAGIRDGTKPEPIRCPMCEMERVSGPTCPNPECGFTHQKSVRHVIQEDGKMVTREGKLIRPKYIRLEPNTAELWKKLVMGAWKWKKNRSFKQLEAWFRHEHGYYPPRDIPLMPKREEDFCRKVWQVPMNQLTGDPKK